MDYVNVLGLVAATLTTSSFVPQLIKVIKTKSTKDISFEMFLTLSIGIFIWLIYGICLNSLPIILGNAIGLIFNLMILGYKIKYK